MSGAKTVNEGSAVLLIVRGIWRYEKSEVVPDSQVMTGTLVEEVTNWQVLTFGWLFVQAY
jgi:hypothetical protein